MSNIIRDYLKKLTPEEIDRMRAERKAHINSLSIEYQLGLYIGDRIVTRYLPTLSIDMIKTRNVINVTPEEEKEYNRLQDAWFNKRDTDNKAEWDLKIAYYRELADKYYPKELICYVNPLSIGNMGELKRGISAELWNCDICEYKLEVKDIEVIIDTAIYSTIIKLTYGQ